MKKGYKSPEDFETIDELCHTLRLPAGEQGKCTRYTIEAAQHGQPEDFYAKLMSQNEGKSYDAVRQELRRATMTLWTNGAGVFHEENSEYPGPLETVRELAYWFTRKF